MGKLKKFYRKSNETIKLFKSSKKRLCTKKNRAASASVSEENKNYYTLDLKTMAAFGVSIVHTHPQPLYTGPPVRNSAADPKNWDAFNKSLMEGPSENVFNPSLPESAPKEYCNTLNLEAMAAFGVSIVHNQPQLLYTGPPVLNSAADPKNWDAFNKSLMETPSENVFNPSPEPAPKGYCDCDTLNSVDMAAFGVSIFHTHLQPLYTCPPVLNSAADPKNWDAFNKSLMEAPSKNAFNPSSQYCDINLETMAAFGASIFHTHPQPLYTRPLDLNSAADPPKNWDALNKFLMEAPSQNVFNPSPPEPAPKDYRDTLNLDAMSTFKVSIVHTDQKPLYTGPPVLNSAAVLKNWDAFNKPLMEALRENVFNPSPPESALKDYCVSHYLEAMPAFGSSIIHTHPQLRDTGPSVLNSAADRKNWDTLNPYPCSYPVFAGP